MRKISNEIIDKINEFRRTPKDTFICFAPFKNLSLNTSGNIAACPATFNYNKEESYPEKSLLELWNSKHLNDLRSDLSNGFLSEKCNHCYNELMLGNYTTTLLNGFDNNNPINSNGMPTILDIDLSNQCNLQCIMCDGLHSSLIRKNIEKKEPLQTPYDDKFIEQLKEFLPHLSELRIQGGEPLTDTRYYEIWEMAVQYNPKITLVITTNGTLFTDRFEQLLRKVNVRLSVSIDALEKEVYEQIRVNANFERTMKNINRYIALSKEIGFQLHIPAVPMKNNWQQIPLLLDFCNLNKVNFWIHTMLTPQNLSLKFLPSEELQNIYSELIKHKPTCDEENWTVSRNNMLYETFINQIKSWGQ